MLTKPYPPPQTDPPLPPRETLPTMYDLPSEDPEEPGLPDEYHDLQPQLLTRTFRCRRYPPQHLFTGTDLNLYYDARHSKWHKRPDWFLVLGVPRLYDEIDLRRSYVVWQEGVNPFIVVELLSPGTAAEDLGENIDTAAADEGSESSSLPSASKSPQEDELPESGNGKTRRERPPHKWEVYEQILRVPYYIVFSRYTNRVRFFKLVGGGYQEQAIDPANPRIWIPELEVGLGLWDGNYEGISRQWLRWYDECGEWILTDTEQALQDKELALEQVEQEHQRAEQEHQRAEQEHQRAEAVTLKLQQVALNLLQEGMTVQQVAKLMGLQTELLTQWQQSSKG